MISQCGEAIRPIFKAMFQILVTENFKLIISFKSWAPNFLCIDRSWLHYSTQITVAFWRTVVNLCFWFSRCLNLASCTVGPKWIYQPHILHLLMWKYHKKKQTYCDPVWYRSNLCNLHLDGYSYGPAPSSGYRVLTINSSTNLLHSGLRNPTLAR